MVEITHERNLLRFRCAAEESGVMQVPFGGIERQSSGWR
jgi:hypothetical protein